MGGFAASMAAVVLGDRLILDNLITYAAPLGAIIFATLWILVPRLSESTLPLWAAAIPIVLALVLGVA